MSNRRQNHRPARQSARRTTPPGTGKKRSESKKQKADSTVAAVPLIEPPLPPLQLGFVRGVAPSKWADRWQRVVRNQALELVPVALDEVEQARMTVDVLLERTKPGAVPIGSSGELRDRHAIRLYDEAVALVVDTSHELAREDEVGLDDLDLITLLDHPDHLDEWPAAEPWADSAWMPQNAESALELVATGLGAALLPLPLARHLGGRRTHAVIPVVTDETPLPGTVIWATWATARDAGDVQRLIGIMRGRTAHSSR